MRVNMGREGRTSSSLSANGGTMLGSLILANGPSQPLEAATKYYVDTAFANLNANNVLDGVLPISSLPGFTGDATSPQGSNVITLTNLGVTPGSYAKVIVDAKGRVTGNDILSNSDIPEVSWDKVQNKPNTLEGYGITDALSVTGGVFDGQMSVIAPTNSMSAVNKQYVDAALSGNSAVVGDIIRKPFASTPSGFLRCNGGMVDKVMYADLYSIIGDNFNKYTVAGSGRPWQQQYEINSEQSGDLTGWSSYGNLPEILHSGMFAVTKNRVYKFGGASTNNGYFTTVYYANINSDGSLGAWTNGINLPTYIITGSVIVLKNKLYIIGGSSPTGPLSTVYTAPINADGSLGSWSIYNNLPAPIAGSASFITKNRIYTLGGYNSSSIPVATVYYANISSDGSIGNWVSDTNLPSAVASSQLFITKNRVYLCGGIGAANNVLATVYTAPINQDGSLGTWTTGTALPVATYNAQYFSTKTRAYIIGGNNTTSTRTAAVYTATINQDGTLGSWGAATSLPYAVANAHSFIVKNKLYLLGGGSNADWLSAIYSCPVYGGKNDYSSYYSVGDVNYLMPGSGRPWEQQYQINTTQSTDITGWSITTALPAIQGNSHVVVTKNRVYLIGGKDNAGYLNTVYTASINSDGTLGSWIVDTPFPIPISNAQLVTTKARVYLIGGRNTSGYLNVIYYATINADGTLGTWIKHAEYVYKVLSGSGSFNISTGTTNITIHGKGGAGTTGSVTWTNPEIDYGGGYVNGSSAPPSLTGYPPPSTIVMSSGSFTWNFSLSTYNTTYAIYIIVDGWKIRYQYNAAPVTTGTASTFTVNGVTYTSNGGIGVAAVQTTNNLTFPGTNPIPVSYNIASGGSGDISYSNGNYLPYPISSGSIFVARNTVYLVGGYVNGAYSAAVYTAPIDANGVIGAWSASTSLPGVLAFSSIALTNNRVYLIGGSTDGSNSVATVYTAAISATGVVGTWTTGTSLTTPVCKASILVTKNKLYIIGGNTANNVASSLVQTAVINADGTLGNWVAGTAIPGAFSESNLIATKDHVYLINGSIGSTYTNTVYIASISDSINDYTGYYDGSIIPYVEPVSSNFFALPDFSAREKNGVNFYIKY